MGTKVRKNGQTLEGVDIYMGGKVGKDPKLGTCIQKSVACEDLQPILKDILLKQFGAKVREQTAAQMRPQSQVAKN